MTSATHRRARVALLVAALVGFVSPTIPASAAAAPPASAAAAPPASQVPYQLIAKAYTELLGRAPDPGGWTSQVAYWQGRPCTAASVQGFIHGFVSAAAAAPPPGFAGVSGELAAHAYTPAQLTLLAYRFVLDRDPDPAGFALNRNAIAADGLLPVIDAMDDAPEFVSSVVPAVCAANPADGFGSAPATTAPAAGTAQLAPDSTNALQAALDAATGTVTLPQGAVFGLSRPLVIPSGIILTTAGSPGPDEYPKMARLVRLSTFATAPAGPLVEVEGTGQLRNVWVDGQRSVYPSQIDSTGAGGMDVELRGGATIDGAVVDDRLTGATGRMAVVAWSANDGVSGEAPCGPNTTIAGNLIDSYSSVHLAPGPGGGPSSFLSSDGIQVWCGTTTLAGNSIVDATDAAIVLFATAGGDQASQVRDNTIISAGNNAFYGIVADPLAPGTPRCDEGGRPGGAVASKDYGGTDVYDNHIWTGDRTHIDVLLSLGTDEDLGTCEHPGGPGGIGELNGTGAVFQGNDDDGLETRTEVAIYVGGMLDAQVPATNHFAHIVLEPAGMPLRADMVVATGTGTPEAPNYAVGLVTGIAYTPDTALVDDAANNTY